MDDIELGRQVGIAMRETFSDDAEPNLSSDAIRTERTASRRAIVVVSAAACAALVVAAVVLIQIVRAGAGAHGRPGGKPTSVGPTATASSSARDRVDRLTFRYPASWIIVPPGGPPTPGLANIGQYLTNATVVRGCAVRSPGGRSLRRCSRPVRALRAHQVLISISEGRYVWPTGAPTRVVRGHRRSLQYGKVTSFADAVADCPTGTTNYLQMTIDESPTTDEPRGLRRAPFSGYGIEACANSPTKTTPAQIKQMIETVRITEQP